MPSNVFSFGLSIADKAAIEPKAKEMKVSIGVYAKRAAIAQARQADILEVKP